MDIGISLPTAVPSNDRKRLLGWARRAERLGFSTLATGDRLVYENYEPLVALAAAAAVTERIALMTAVLIVPNRGNPALLAKQVASVDALSEGRLVLGVGLGGRRDDYAAAGIPIAGRGKRFDDALDEMKRIWAGEARGFAGPIGPALGSRQAPPVLVGGHGDATARRVADLGDGWIMGEGTPEDFRRMRDAVKTAWFASGRTGKPRLVGLCYFTLGERAESVAATYLDDYYAWLGDPPAISLNVAVTTDAAQRFRDAFSEAGADELIYFPCSAEPEDVDRLAACVL